MPSAPKHHAGRTRDLAPLTVRLSREERAEVDRRARAAMVSVSEYVRAAALGRRAAQKSATN